MKKFTPEDRVKYEKILWDRAWDNVIKNVMKIFRFN
jgi:hypothetical protein